MRRDEVIRLTSHGDVNIILLGLTAHIGQIAGSQLVGLYLTGSLTYGDFDRGSSDIDYLAILEGQLTPAMRAELAEAHAAIGRSHPEWESRIEGSYITRSMLSCLEPPAEPRPYINGGAFWDPDPRYGHEWLVNLYALRACGVALLGPPAAQLIPPIAIEDVRRASWRDLLEEWVPKLEDPAYFDTSHHHAYVTLTICRILHRAVSEEVVSKRVAAAWVRQATDEPWIVELIDRAARWQHGDRMGDPQPVLDLIAFARNRWRQGLGVSDGPAPAAG